MNDKFKNCLDALIEFYVYSGPPKPKEEVMGGWNNGASNQWGGNGPNVGGNNGNNGAAGGWGPPPNKAGGAGGWGSNTAPGPAPQRPQQWDGGDNHSPTMARRFDDGGTSIWGGKSQAGGMTGPGGPPGGQ